jgi:hypothetical protein
MSIKKPTSQATKGLIIEWTFTGKSPLTPLPKRGIISSFGLFNLPQAGKGRSGGIL